jgi:hypothetical protein
MFFSAYQVHYTINSVQQIYTLHTSASSGITQGGAPSSWRAFLAPSAYRVWHRQCTPLVTGSAPGVPNLPTPPGDMAHIRRALANALLAWATVRLPPPPETLGWSDPAHSTYGTFASFDYISGTMRALPNALTVFLNSLMACRMLSQHGGFSHGTANAHASAPANIPANATAKAPANAHGNAHANAHPSIPSILTNAHRVEAFVIPTQSEATLTFPPLY